MTQTVAFDCLKFAIRDAAVTENSCLRIEININGLHSKPNFAATNVNHFSNSPFNVTPETPTLDTALQPVTDHTRTNDPNLLGKTLWNATNSAP